MTALTYWIHRIQWIFSIEWVLRILFLMAGCAITWKCRSRSRHDCFNFVGRCFFPSWRCTGNGNVSLRVNAWRRDYRSRHMLFTFRGSWNCLVCGSSHKNLTGSSTQMRCQRRRSRYQGGSYKRWEIKERTENIWSKTISAQTTIFYCKFYRFIFADFPKLSCDKSCCTGGCHYLTFRNIYQHLSISLVNKHNIVRTYVPFTFHYIWYVYAEARVSIFVNYFYKVHVVFHFPVS